MLEQESLNFESEQIPNREFLGWDAPLLDSVKGWLLERNELLSRTLVVVPTANSGRRLRMALSSGGGVFSPHVMPPSRLFEVEAAASRQDVLWAWVAAIRELNVEDFPHLFPHHTPGSTRSFSAALALARQMVTLRDMLADGDADFRDAAHHSPEKERWQEISKIEGKMLKHLSDWKLSDPVLAKRKKAQSPELPVGVDRIVIACVPDPTLLASRALESFLAAGVPVTVLIHAPESEAASFDYWGTPLSDVWEKKRIDIPDWKERLHVVDSSTEAAGVCVQVFGEGESTAEGSALALCDATFAPALEKKFGESSWPLYDPEGKGLADSGLMRLLRIMRDLSGRERSFDALRKMVGLPGAGLFLPPETTRQWAASMMDSLHLAHLPETVSDARFLASEKQKPIVESISSKLDELKPGQLSGTLRTWLIHWLESSNRALVKAVEGALIEALDALERLESYGANPAPEDAFEMLAESLQGARIPTDRADTVLDLQGWLELSYDPASHLVLAGMHEECVPDGAGDDLFVPDSLRKDLGLRDSRGRFARDAFLFKAALSSRLAHGRVDAVVARFNDAGEARKPSRLLMRQTGEELAAIVTHLFAESDSSASTGGAWERDWTLAFPEKENPYTEDPPRGFSPSAIKDYMNCPLRFYLKRIVKMNVYDAEKREMDAMDFGNLCHGVVEVFGKDTSIRDSMDAAEISDYLSHVLDERMKKKFGGHLSLPLMVQLESARERLRAFAEKQAAERADGWRIVETEFQVGRDGIAWEFADHPITMIIDRIDCHEDGKQWRVWDYKTSGKAKHPEDQHHATWKEEESRLLLGDLIPAAGRKKERRWADVQLPFYAAFVQQHYRTSDLPQVGYINLPRAVSDVGFCAWEGFDQEILDHALSWARAAMEEIKKGNFRQATVLSTQEKEWDDFSELAPDGLASAFSL